MRPFGMIDSNSLLVHFLTVRMTFLICILDEILHGLQLHVYTLMFGVPQCVVATIFVLRCTVFVLCCHAVLWTELGMLDGKTE